MPSVLENARPHSVSSAAGKKNGSSLFLVWVSDFTTEAQRHRDTEKNIK
jgi:hypothetical protein